MNVKTPKKIPGILPSLIIPVIYCLSIFLAEKAIAQNAEAPQTTIEKYRLVFPTGYEDSLLYDSPPKDKKEEKARNKAREKNYPQRRKAERLSFLQELNKAGAQKYRLLSATSRDIAITVRGEKQYEYFQYQADDTYSYSANDGGRFEKWFAPLANQGFSLVDYSYTGSACREDENQMGQMTDCEYRYSFILERQKGAYLPQQFNVTKGGNWHSKGEVQAEQIYKLIPQGFFPSHIFSSAEILLQNLPGKIPDFSDKSQILIASTISSTSGIFGLPKFTSLPRSINFLAKQGYRIALTHHNIALMYRNRGFTDSAIYWWVDLHSPDFEYEILRLQERGAIYRLRALRRGIDEPYLIFEQPTEPTAMQREYKILKLQLQETEHFAAKKVTIDLAPAAKETMKQINLLAQEGYEVRDLFVHDYSVNGCGVLLERIPAKPKEQP